MTDGHILSTEPLSEIEIDGALAFLRERKEKSPYSEFTAEMVFMNDLIAQLERLLKETTS